MKEQRQYNGAKTVSSTNVLEQLDIHMQKNESRHRFYTHQKISSKWIIDLNVKYKTIKLLKDNVRENLDDFGYGNNFLNITPKL